MAGNSVRSLLTAGHALSQFTLPKPLQILIHTYVIYIAIGLECSELEKHHCVVAENCARV